MNVSEYSWDYRDPYQWMHRVRTSSLPPMIICCAITGGVQGKEANANLPETPEEQAEQTYEAYKAGASMVHNHARDPQKWYDGTGDPRQSRLVNALIREKCPDIIINNTTGGGPGMSVEARLSTLEAGPEVATLNMGPDVSKFNFKERKAPLASPRAAFASNECMSASYADITMFARRMKERGIKPEMEIYHPGMFWVCQDLINQGLLGTPYLIQFVMGYQTSSYPTPADLLLLIDRLPSQSVYAVAGIGPFQMPMTVMSILLGGHVRVGMEDNVYYSRGQLLERNVQAVERIVRIAREMNRDIATPAQARQMMGLSSKPSTY
jgi:3-keto-5-aminohexanoate cleavage enzyme